MFGFGITQKIIDCYVAIIGVWEKTAFTYSVSAVVPTQPGVF